MTSARGALKERLLSHLPEEMYPSETTKQSQVEMCERVFKVLELTSAAREVVHTMDLIQYGLVDSTIAAGYLRSLRRALWVAIGAVILSALMGMVSGSVLIEFVRTGISILHPYLAIFLGLWSVALLSVAVASAFAVKRRIESYIEVMLRETYSGKPSSLYKST